MNIGNWLIIVLYLLLPLGQLQKLPLGIPAVSIYVHDLVLLGLWGYILWRSVISTEVEKSLFKFKKGFVRLRRTFAQNDKVAIPLAVFTSIALFSWLINYFRWGEESFIGFGYLVRWVLLAAPLFMLTIDYRLSSKILRQSIFITALIGFIQYLFFPDLTQFKYFGWDDHFFRLTGTLLDPNFMGALLVLGLGLEFSNSQFSIFKPVKKLFYLVALGLTYSRASWLAWLVLLFGYTAREIFTKPLKKDIFLIFRTLIRSLKVPAFYFWLIISGVVFLLLPRPAGEGGDLTRTASIIGRKQSYQQAAAVIKDNPLFGVGFNNYRLYRKDKSRLVPTDHAGAGVDNSFLFVWATTGIFGLIAFIWLVFSFQPVWLILPIVVHAFFNNTLFFPWVLIYLWGIQANEN